MPEDCVWRLVSRFSTFIHFPFCSVLDNADCDIGTHVYHDKASASGKILRSVHLSYSVIVHL